MRTIPIKTVVIFGAGGQLGTRVLRAFLAAPEFTTTVLCREDTASTYPSNVHVERTDMSAGSLERILEGKDAVISTVTHMAFEAQEAVLQAAVRAGVRRFMPSEYGGDTSNEELLRVAPFTATKRGVTDKLRSLEGQGPEGLFSWTSVVPGPFLEWVLQSGEFGIDSAARKVTLYGGGDIPFATTKLGTIADAVVGVLRHPDATANRYVYVRSALVTHRQLLGALETITGPSWTVGHERVEDLRAVGLQRIAEGDFLGNLDLICAAILTKGTGFDFEQRNDLLGIGGDEPVEALVREVVGDSLTGGASD